MLKINNIEVNIAKFNGADLSRLSFNGQEVWSASKPEPITRNYLQFYANEGDVNIGVNDLSLFNNLQYSTGDENKWKSFPSEGVLVPDGERIYLKGEGTLNRWAAKTFTTSSRCECHGNVMSLLGEDFENLTALPIYVFRGLFKSSKITTAPELPATTLGEGCYYEMFHNCASLVNAPALPATTLAKQCYYAMFFYCQSLVNAPELPATTLANGCYTSMFLFCASLVNAPALPARTLADSCYQNMFYYCQSLINAPELPATTLYNYCYSQMFQGCTSLVNAPALPATTLANGCYNSMFNECRKLNQVIISANTWDSNYTNNWLLDVASTGTVYYTGDNPPEGIPTDSTSGVPTGWTLEKYVEPITRNYLQFYANEGDVTIGVNDLSLFNNLQYSRGTEEGWESFPEEGVLVPDGERIYLKGTGTSTSYSDRTFTTSERCECHGNTMSLLSEDFENLSAVTENVFRGLFKSSKITTAPELPATTLAVSCYRYMFNGCTSLVNAPELPATTLADYCYNLMFSGCSSLVNAPELPATTLESYCYQNMFQGCTKLVNAPALPATTLDVSCYYGMFQGCTKLVNAPALPATTLTTQCYCQMFYNCTSLVTAPALPARTLANSCYNQMFYKCTSLTTVPDCAPNAPNIKLPATTLDIYCYYAMFYGCTRLYNNPSYPFIIYASSLTSSCLQYMFYNAVNVKCIKINVKTWNTTAAQNWLSGATSGGLIIVPSGSNIPTNSVSGVPSGWTLSYI